MRRYFLPSDSARLINNESYEFDIRGDYFHHIIEVCRLEKGSRFEVLDGSGLAYLVKLISVDRKQARAQEISRRSLPITMGPKINLAISIPRFPVFEAVLEKAVEMGVSEIVPFFSKYSFIRDSSKLSAERMARWRKIVLSATQQSGQAKLLTLREPVALSEMLENINRNQAAYCLCAYEGSATSDIKTVLENQSFTEIGQVWIVVGSEGGFALDEVQSFIDCNWPAVTLGDQVLRVETACITLVAALKYRLGQFVSRGL